MPKKLENHGKPWTDMQVQQLKVLVGQNIPTRVIGLKLSRTEGPIWFKASEEDTSLKSTNQSACNQREK